MSTGNQLAAWCKKHHVKGFSGVFCSDELPETLPDDGFAGVINHSPCNSRTGGTHWLACRIDNHTAYWYDSYGLPPTNKLETVEMGPEDGDPHFDAWLTKLGVTNTYYNARDMQSVGTDVCGLYACYFLKHGLPAQSPGAWRFLSSDKKANDAMIAKLVQLKP